LSDVQERRITAASSDCALSSHRRVALTLRVDDSPGRRRLTVARRGAAASCTELLQHISPMWRALSPLIRSLVRRTRTRSSRSGPAGHRCPRCLRPACALTENPWPN
jgi:hypothetical protein